jgi:hypothetical protein
MTPEQKLAALFAAEAPPARDYAFQTKVAERIAVRRAWMTVLALSPWAIAATALLWALQPVVAPLSQGLETTIEPSALVLAGAMAAGVAALWLSRRFSAA